MEKEWIFLKYMMLLSWNRRDSADLQLRLRAREHILCYQFWWWHPSLQHLIDFDTGCCRACIGLWGFSPKCFVMILVFSGWSCPPVQDKNKFARLKCKLPLNSISIQSQVKKVLLLSSWWSHEGLCVSLDLPWMFLSLPVKCLQLFSCEVCRTANIGWLLRYIKKTKL